MDDFTDEEREIILDANLRDGQLKRFRAVLNSSLNAKKQKRLEQEILPGYLTRELNARSKAEHLMKKKGWYKR